jgi:hypothetical protein
MNKKQTLMLAMAGAALVAASPTQAQISPAYSAGDLLLNFRNPSTTATTPDVTVDLGQISVFSGLTGTTALDTTANNGYTPLFTSSELNTAFGGSVSGIGFSAVAATAGDLFLTRVQSTTSAPTTKSASVSGAAFNTFANAVNAIGGGASGANGTVASSLDAGNRIVSVTTAQTQSYQSEGTFNSGNTINYGGAINTVAGAGGLMESAAGSSPVYSALWEQAPNAASSADTYLGYFTFDPNGEVDFTSVNAVPEPSTYGLIACAGLLALVFRRQLRSLTA